MTSRILFTAKQKDELGSAGRTDKVCWPSPGRWKGGTRPASSGSWLSMEGSPAAALQSCGGVEA